MELTNVAVSTFVPGRPGMDTSDRSTTQVTVTVTDAGVPTGAPKPEVSTFTSSDRHSYPWLLRLVFAVFRASVFAWSSVREMDAARAASWAADWMAWSATSMRIAVMAI